MSDSTSMFILYVLELLRWNGDTETLRLYYPTVRRAALWQMNVSSEFGVPLKLETTYDILQFPKYQLSTYASVVRPPNSLHCSVLSEGIVCLTVWFGATVPSRGNACNGGACASIWRPCFRRHRSLRVSDCPNRPRQAAMERITQVLQCRLQRMCQREGLQ